MIEAHWHTQNEPPFVDLPSTTGINRLPMDLLTRIFALILREYHEDPEPHYTKMDRARAPLVYMHICCRWRAIALADKSLWQKPLILCDEGDGALNRSNARLFYLFEKRSFPLPLTFYITYGFLRKMPTEVKLHHIPCLLLYARRTERVRIESAPHDVAFALFMSLLVASRDNSGLPLLKRLDFFGVQHAHHAT
jgi:hypothetical protein